MHDESLSVPVTPDTYKLLTIVRRLAARAHLERRVSTGEIVCIYCNKINELHTPNCLWFNAVEALDAH